MSVDEKVSEEEKQKHSVLSQLLERTLAANEDWTHLYSRIILIGYTNYNSTLPLLLPLGGYTVVAMRHQEIRDLFTGNVLVYFSGDKEPSFCQINKLYEFVIEQAVIKKLVSPEKIVQGILRCQKELFGN